MPLTAGYSVSPLAKKLGVKPGHTLVLLGAPAGWSIPDLDPGVEIRTDLRRSPDVVVAFVRSQRDLQRASPRLVRVLAADASAWVVWPRKAGGHVSDVTEQALRDELLPTGLVDTKVAALDENWSGLRFVWRRERRPAPGRRPGRR